LITIQYLEDAPELLHLDTGTVVRKLRDAYQQLPFSHLLIGWNLPRRLLEACRLEAESLDMRFLRWHPLLTGDAVFEPRSEWQVIGVDGAKVMGFRNLPEFTFVCPNHPQVQEVTLNRISELVSEGVYQGFFLDRIRFPSPAADPFGHLGCFCEHCIRKAAGLGLDLVQVRRRIAQLRQTEQGCVGLVQSLLGVKETLLDESTTQMVGAFLDFRQQSVTDFVTLVCNLLQEGGMEIGLDCFSPGLMRMVGQDLSSLSRLVDWVKVMTYLHTVGPAGLPFELLGILDHLLATTRLPVSRVLTLIGNALGLPLPESRQDLVNIGLPSRALQVELRRGLEYCHAPLLVGIELVELEGVANPFPEQIKADLAEIKATNVGGIAISWDLWHIPLTRLELVRQVYLEG
jgi:hypothetical protein